MHSFWCWFNGVLSTKLTMRLLTISSWFGKFLIILSYNRGFLLLFDFRTHGGVKKTESTITSPTIMWVKALDLLMDRLRLTGLDFHDVAALSGAGQVKLERNVFCYAS